MPALAGAGDGEAGGEGAVAEELAGALGDPAAVGRVLPNEPRAGRQGLKHLAGAAEKAGVNVLGRVP